MLRKLIEEALTKARRVLLDCLSMGLTQIEGRGKFGDYSMKFDVLTERAMIDVVRRGLDRVYIITEEAGHIPCDDPEYYVVIDPVDGSMNAARGIPVFASSIAVAESPDLGGVIAAGVIEHCAGRLYVGERDGGVYVDGVPGTLGAVRSLSDAVVMVDLAALKKELEDDYSPRRWCTQIVNRARNVRFLGAASLEIALMLRGGVNAYACVCRDLKIMDFCASISLIKWLGGDYMVLGGGDGGNLLLRLDRFGVIAASTQDLLREIWGLRSLRGE